MSDGPVGSIWDTEAEHAAIRSAFDTMDRDGDGKIVPKDLIQEMQAQGIRLGEEEETTRVYNALRESDKDKGGVMEFEEFRGLMSSLIQPKDFKTQEDYDKVWRDMVRDPTKQSMNADDLRDLFAEFGEDPESIDTEKMIRWAREQAKEAGIDEGSANTVSKAQVQKALYKASYLRRS